MFVHKRRGRPWIERSPRSAFAKEVWAWLLGSGRTQQQAAEVIGTTARTLQRWVTEDVVPLSLTREAVLARIRSAPWDAAGARDADGRRKVKDEG